MDGVDNTTWRTASYSGNSGNCVEAGVADATRVVLVRDSANRDGAKIKFTAGAWKAFTDALK
jgi:uncharacterized protein DUF397